MQLSAISLALTRIYGGGFSPSKLFANNEVGAWYDPSDLSTMFQDSAGATPVTADGQPVGKILDKSGRGNHAFQATAAARPLYKTDGTYHWLQFDGVDDSLSTAAIDFTSTDKMSVWHGLKTSNDTGFDGIFSISSGVPGSLWAYFDNEAMNLKAQGSSGISSIAPAWYASNASVITGAVNLGGSTGAECLSLSKNGAFLKAASVVAGASNFISAALVLGNTSGLMLTGNMYSFILRGEQSSTQEVLNANNWVIAKTPVVYSAIALGDSIIASYLGSVDIFNGFASQYIETNLAYSGATIANQETAWLGGTANTPKWVGIQVGTNDLIYSEAASVAIARLQSLVTTVRSMVTPTTKILIGKMTPCKQRLIDLYGGTNGLISYQKWLDMNTAIGGGGATPITGIDVVASAHVTTLNDGSDNLAVAYDVGDHVHPNNTGRQLISDSWVSALQSIGVTP